MPFLHRSIHVIKDNWQKIFIEENGYLRLNRENAEEYIKESLNEFEKFFSTVTGTPCRACIKVIDDYSILRVKTFTRGTYAYSGYHFRKSKSNDDKSNDLIENNSDFFEIVYNSKSSWHIEDIDKEKHYLNSHLKINSKKKFSQQLGYKTTFTWPIRRLISNKDNEPEIYGFLCVDSKTSNVFDRIYDFDSGALMADFYYFLLQTYFRVAEENLRGNR